MDVGNLSVVTLDWSVDGKLRKERISRIGQRATKALVPGKSSGARPVNGSAKGKFLEPAAVRFAEGVEAESSNDFRLVRGVSDRIALAVKCAHPVLHDAAVNISMQG